MDFFFNGICAKNIRTVIISVNRYLILVIKLYYTKISCFSVLIIKTDAWSVIGQLNCTCSDELSMKVYKHNLYI